MATVETSLIAAEEFARLAETKGPCELVRGRIVPLNMPYPRHGQICGKVDRIVGSYTDEHHLGHLITNDSGVRTEEDPDTVRGADLAFYSFQRVPPGPFPQGYLAVVPEVVFEVRSPGDTWKKMLAKVLEYLNAGVSLVCVLDQMTETMHIYTSEDPDVVLKRDDEFSLPAHFGDLHVPVRRFFE